MEWAISSKLRAFKFGALDISAPAFLGLLISTLLIFCGIIFRTYTISMSSGSMEAARQLGLPFMLAEMAFIFAAARNGLDPASIWRQLPRYVRWVATSFLCTFWIGSVFFSPVMMPSITHNLFFLIHLIFAAAIYSSIGRFGVTELDSMAKNLAIGLAIFCVMTAYAFLFHPPLSSMPNKQIIWQFAIPGFISLRLFGAFCGAIFCFMLGILLIAEENKRLNIWYFMWLTLSATMMIWSGTRAAVVGSLSAFIVVALIYRFRPSAYSAMGIAVCLVVSTILAIALIPYGDATFMVIAAGDGASTDAISGGRISYWTAVWKAYEQVPIFGGGPFASSFLIEKGQQVHVQPHNIVLQFLITWGFLAASLALILLAIATWHVHRIALLNRMVIPLLLMLDCLLVMSLFDGMMHFAQHLMLIMICFGMIFGYQRVQAASLITKIC
jgi:exopolysaccharide production protein ExoQ